MRLSNEAIRNLLDVLRFNTLTLAAISLGLLSNVLIVINDISAKARDDLHELLRITHSVDYTAESLIFDAAKKADSHIVQGWIKVFILGAQNTSLPVSWKVTVSFPSVLHADISIFAHSPHSTKGDADDKPPTFIDPKTKIKDLSTLEKCRLLWNGLANNRQSLFVSASPKRAILKATITQQEFGLTAREFKFKDEKEERADPEYFAFPTYPYRLWLSRTEDSQSPILNCEWSPQNLPLGMSLGLYTLLKDGNELHMQFATTPIKSDPLWLLLDTVGHVEPKLYRANRFADAFPNLAKWGKNYGTIKLEDLNTILEEQSKQSRGELEIFGAKIPNELVALIGIPSIILLLFQFISTALYLLNNVEPINVDQASRWPLLLKGFGFGLMGLSTTLFLPVIASVATVTYATPETSYRIWFWCSLALFVIVLSGVATMLLDSLRRKVTYESGQASSSSGEVTSPDAPESVVI